MLLTTWLKSIPGWYCPINLERNIINRVRSASLLFSAVIRGAPVNSCKITCPKSSTCRTSWQRRNFHSAYRPGSCNIQNKVLSVGDLSRFFPRFDRIFFSGKHLSQFFSYQDADFRNLVLHKCIVIFNAEQVDLNLQVTNFKNKEVTANTQPQTLEKRWYFENSKPFNPTSWTLLTKFTLSPNPIPYTKPNKP